MTERAGAGADGAAAAAPRKGRGLDWIRDQQADISRLPAPRYGGVLAHPTSLPGGQGIGDLGQGPRDFIDWLASAKQTRWQVLPLGPTGYGDSPYQSFSTFAGNPLLISLDMLVAEGILHPADIGEAEFPSDRVDFASVIPAKLAALRKAARGFRSRRGRIRQEFNSFQAEQAGWLDDFALFMAIKSEHEERPWWEWPAPLAMRDTVALERTRRRAKDDIEWQKLMQFFFFRQWRAVKAYANQHDIQIIGDIPIFVARDSADVWAHTHGFQLDAQGQPTAVAGVPPDYFSADGQLWGNPLYDWDAMAASGYDWWIARVRATLAMVDILRIDHFRGFEAYWAVPYGEDTARNGTWVKGPNRAVFDAIREALGTLPIIAEDLGVITTEVDQLRDELGFPGMAVLQFAFGTGPDNLYLPHNVTRRLVAYSGTHDNDTTRGWYETQEDALRDHLRRYLRVSGDDIAWDAIRTVYASVAETAIVPLQDVLGLGSEARMNVPGKLGGNWSWRMTPGALTHDHAAGLAGLAELYGRLGERKPAPPRKPKRTRVPRRAAVTPTVDADADADAG